MSNRNTKAPDRIESFNSNLQQVLSELEEGHYLFIIADQKKASLFLFNKGEVEQKLEFMHPGVRKLVKKDSGELYGRNDKLSRHIDKQIHEHIKLLMKQVETLIQGKHINGVFIGGHKPLHRTIEKELPKELQEKIRGTFLTELNISEEELIKHCTQVLKEYTA